MSEQKTISKRILFGLLSVLLAIAFMPAGAFAAGTGTSGITVYLTVSDKGSIAAANDGSVMAWKEVNVKDIDGDGTYSYDEALVAAHAAYNKSDGYALTASSYGSYVTKIWGEETSSTLFFDNGKAIATGVTATKVQNGDSIEAAVLSDSQYYSDYFSAFDRTKANATRGKAVKLNLSGFPGMNGGDPAAISGAEVSTWNSGKLTKIGTTDKDGNVSVTFNKAGTYLVTAKGTIQSTAQDYSNYPDVKEVTVEAPTIAPACIVTVKNPTLAKTTVKAKGTSWTSVKISWKKVKNAKTYQVYRASKKNGTYKKVKTTSKLSWSNKNLKTGKKYYYKVKAAASGFGSSTSGAKAAKAVTKAPSLKLTAGKNTIKATWTKVSGSTGYKLYRATAKNGKYKVIRKAVGVDRHEYTSINKKTGKKYYYKIRAYKKADGKTCYGAYSPVKVKAAK